MKHKKLQKLLLDAALKTDPQNEGMSVLNAEFADAIYGGRVIASDCPVKSGPCPDLTSCGTYATDCNGKCGVNFVKATPLVL